MNRCDRCESDTATTSTYWDIIYQIEYTLCDPCIQQSILEGDKLAIYIKDED